MILNIYTKFHENISKSFLVIARTRNHDGWTDGQTDGRTDRRTDRWTDKVITIGFRRLRLVGRNKLLESFSFIFLEVILSFSFL